MWSIDQTNGLTIKKKALPVLFNFAVYDSVLRPQNGGPVISCSMCLVLGGAVGWGGGFKMALHKKHRVIIALGNNNNDVYKSFFSHLEEM